MGRHSGDFLVRPFDTVWFRGPRPFVAGEDSLDLGVFPPTPWTFQGLVRSRLLLAALPGDLDAVDRGTVAQLVGPPNQLPDGWRLEGPHPARAAVEGELEPWFATPRFLLRASGGDQLPPVRARAAPEVAASADGVRERQLLTDLPPDRKLLGSPRDGQEALGGWISAANLWWACTHKTAWSSAGHAPDLPAFVEREVRPGVGIDRKLGTAADHLLYSATHHRFDRGAGLLGRLTATSDSRIPDDALWRGWGQAGRRGRLVELEGPAEVDSSWRRLRAGEHLPPSAAAVPDPVLAWVALLTPALAESADPPFRLPGFPVRAAVVGQLTAAGPDLGGFDRAGGGGRPVRASWAAGSAWLIELAGGTAEDRLGAARALQGLEPHLLTPHEAMGFGQRVVALVDPATYLPLPGGTHG